MQEGPFCLCGPSTHGSGTDWACKSSGISFQGFAGDASGFVNQGPLSEITFQAPAGLSLCDSDGSQAPGDLQCTCSGVPLYGQLGRVA